MSTLRTSTRSPRPFATTLSRSLSSAPSSVSVARIRASVALARLIVAMPGPHPISRMLFGAKGTMASAFKVAASVAGPQQSSPENTSMKTAM
jgi:hypothetical protein